MCQINAERGYSRPSDCSELRWWLDSRQKKQNTARRTAPRDIRKEAERVLLHSEGVEVAKDRLSLCFMMLNVHSYCTFLQHYLILMGFSFAYEKFASLMLLR